MTSERDFKTELTVTQNLTLALGLSSRTVLVCSQEFLETDWKQAESIVNMVMPSEVSIYRRHELYGRRYALYGPRYTLYGPLSWQSLADVLGEM